MIRVERDAFPDAHIAISLDCVHGLRRVPNGTRSHKDHLVVGSRVNGLRRDSVRTHGRGKLSRGLDPKRRRIPEHEH